MRVCRRLLCGKESATDCRCADSVHTSGQMASLSVVIGPVVVGAIGAAGGCLEGQPCDGSLAIGVIWITVRGVGALVAASTPGPVNCAFLTIEAAVIAPLSARYCRVISVTLCHAIRTVHQVPYGHGQFHINNPAC